LISFPESGCEKTNRSEALNELRRNHNQAKMKPDKETHRNPESLDMRKCFGYQGPLWEIVEGNRYFFAWKEGRLLGIHRTFEEAIESLALKEILNAR